MAKLTLGASLCWEIAASETHAADFQFIEKEQLLIGALSLTKATSFLDGQPESYILQVLKESKAIEVMFIEKGLKLSTIRRKIRSGYGLGNYKHQGNVIHRSEACKKYFSYAKDLAGKGEDVNTLHIIAAIIAEPGEIISKILLDYNIDLSELYNYILSAANSIKNAEEEPNNNQDDVENRYKTDYLDKYGVDLTRKARDGKIGPIIGRCEELLSVIQTLLRHKKNNPVLVGEAGVGKTAVVEALALKIADNIDLEILTGKRIIELNIGSLLAGTKYRGEFEERLISILEEVKNDTDIIIFIDEIHTLIGAGKGDGSLDAANIIKPALARGDLRCIGATTINEYQKYIESDPALERRFDKIIVSEPDAKVTLDILNGVKAQLEAHHSIMYEKEALEAAVDLSLRFDLDHRLPDKAIDLLDKAGARCQISILKNEHIDNKNNITTEKTVTTLTIASVLADKMSLPLDLVTAHAEGNESKKILELPEKLRNKIKGQDKAIDQVCKQLLMSYSGLSDRQGPLSVFLFLGPTGVGKTELSKQLAEHLFGNSGAMIRIDMSEYMEEHSVAKLIGSPPGYIGYEEEGQLTGNIRSKPYSIVLFDEIEKAHPRIFDLFLQLFDEGRLTDAKGRIANAKNTIFIMTSNITVGINRQLGFNSSNDDSSDTSNSVKEALHKRFRPEFINRIDEQVLFNSLNEEDSAIILSMQLDEITRNLKTKYGVKLIITSEARDFVLKKGYKPEYGARELIRASELYIKAPLSRLAASGNFKEQQVWEVRLEEDTLSFLPDMGISL